MLTQRTDDPFNLMPLNLMAELSILLVDILCFIVAVPAIKNLVAARSPNFASPSVVCTPKIIDSDGQLPSFTKVLPDVVIIFFCIRIQAACVPVHDVLMRMRCNIVVTIAILLHTHQWPEMSLHVRHQDRHIG
jgi:hypothetical protein